MREDQVVSAAVDVEAGSERAERHRHALGVPPGPSLPPWGVPPRLARLGCLPQCEVERRALVRVNIDARTGIGVELGQRAACELSVSRGRVHREVHALARHLVCGPDGQQLGDHVDHLVDEVGGVGTRIRREHAEPIHLGVISGRELRRHGLLRATFALGAFHDLVVDIGDVGCHRHLESSPLQVTPDHVVGQRSTAMAQVRHVVDRRPADIHRDFARRARDEGGLAPRHRVEDLQRARVPLGQQGYR